MKAGYKRRRLLTLGQEQHWQCYWCRRECLKPDDPNYYRKGDASAPTKRAATIDHMYTRKDPRRSATREFGGQRWVMACSRCNQARGKALPEEFAKRVPRENPMGQPFTKARDLHSHGQRLNDFERDTDGSSPARLQGEADDVHS